MKTRIALAALLALTLVGPALAQPPGPGGHGNFAAHMEKRLTHILNLTAAQQTTLDQLASDLTATTKPLHQQQRDNFKQVEALLAGANPDPAAVGQLVIAGNALRGQFKAARDTFDSKFEAILTAEQKAAYEAVKKTMGGHGRGRHGKGGGAWGEPPPPSSGS